MEKTFDTEFDINCKLFPPVGDFSIIENEFYRKSLTFDYCFVKNCHLWNIFTFYNDLKENDPFKIFLKDNFYSLHTNETFENNMFYLEYIYLYGWSEFTIKISNLKL